MKTAIIKPVGDKYNVVVDFAGTIKDSLKDAIEFCRVLGYTPIIEI